MTKTTPPIKRAYERGARKSGILTVSLRPDRIKWVRDVATQRNIAISDVVREALDAARLQSERESMSA